jgi:hypothetical protein
MKMIKTSDSNHSRLCGMSEKSGIRIQEIADILLQRGLAEYENDLDALKEVIRSIYSENEVVVKSLEATNYGIAEYTKFLKKLTRDERRKLTGFIQDHRIRAENVTYNENKRRTVEALNGVYIPEKHGRKV